jgi:glycosyltransferase involved in cell wall biosynthesis
MSSTPDHPVGQPREGAISVIVPARDAAATIGATLSSLVPDRAMIREVLLIDDGSADETARIAVETSRRCRLPLEVVRTSVGAAGAARNVGLARAQGKFIYFLDADDEVVAGGLGVLLDALLQAGGEGIAVGAAIRRTAGRPDKLKLPHGYTADRAANVRNYLGNQVWPIAMGSALVARSPAVAVRFPEMLPFDEDTCYWAGALARAPVVMVPRPVLVYNYVEARMAGRFTSSPRRTFLALAGEFDKLAAGGLDRHVLQWRKAWVASRIARQLILHREFATARGLMRLVRAHPDFRHGLVARRYGWRIRWGLFVDRLRRGGTS